MTQPADYFTYRTFEVQLRGKTYKVVSKPGIFAWDHLDDATQLLAETCEIKPDDTVLDLGCGNGIVGVVAASLAPQGKVYMVDSSIIAVEAAKRTAEANRCTNCEVLISDIASALDNIRFDVVLSNVPSSAGNLVVFQFIDDAYRILKPGGKFYVVGAQSRGIQTFGKRMQATFGNVAPVAMKKGNRVLLSVKAGTASG